MKDVTTKQQKDVHNERVNASVGGKKRAEQKGVEGCEFCGWKAHARFGGKLRLLKLHHVIPAKYKSTYPGNIHDDSNLIVLCPNHAEIADAISGTHDNAKSGSFGLYRGPKSRDELLENLRLIDTDPDTWAANYWAGLQGL